MEFMKSWTHGLADIFFPHCTPKQKRDNIRFFHGMIIFGLAMMFIFAPSRSFARYLILVLYIVFALLYYFLGDCWVAVVEREVYKKGNAAVLDSLLSLLGVPRNIYNQYMITGVAYVFSNLLLGCLMIRDMFGVY